MPSTTVLETLLPFAAARGVRLALENIPNELSPVERIRHFLEDAQLPEVGICFDSGHSHLRLIHTGRFGMARAGLSRRICMTITERRMSICCRSTATSTGRKCLKLSMTFNTQAA